MCQFYRTSVLPRLQQEVNSSQITLSKIQFLEICVPGNFNGNPGVDRWSVEHLSALKQNPTWHRKSAVPTPSLVQPFNRLILEQILKWRGDLQSRHQAGMYICEEGNKTIPTLGSHRYLWRETENERLFCQHYRAVVHKKDTCTNVQCTCKCCH